MSPTTKLLNKPGVIFTSASASTGAALEAVSNNGILTIQRFPLLLIDLITALVTKITPHNLKLLSNNLANRIPNRFNKNKKLKLYNILYSFNFINNLYIKQINGKFS
jgi:hypothetical protein